MQQTRVDQGLPYFLRFIDTFPDLTALAEASEDSVLAKWQGLGYYSRARNMMQTAKYIQSEMGGRIPEKYHELIKLKGIGPYTAAAISSICFNEPKPVVDGNVFRVASRVFGIEADIAESSTRKIFETVLSEIIPNENPGDFNQAIMEYGATVCKPSPNCEHCVLREGCFAFNEGRVNSLPVKSKKTKVKDRKLDYIILVHGKQVLMKKRLLNDIWKGLYDFIEPDELTGLTFTEPITHLLSHQKLSIRFAQLEVSHADFISMARRHKAEPFSIKQILTLPKPKVVADYIQKRFG